VQLKTGPFARNGKEQPGKEECRFFETACVSFNLRKSSRIVSRIYAREMADAPIRGPLFSLLASIHKLGPRTITAVAHDLGLDRTTLTRNLKPLRERGLVEIRQVNANRKEIRLRPKGESALRRSLDCWRKAQKRVVDELGEDRWNRLREDLRAVMALGGRE
jgi:DNA-binding MarR family transcriptional regulator